MSFAAYSTRVRRVANGTGGRKFLWVESARAWFGDSSLRNPSVKGGG